MSMMADISFHREMSDVAVYIGGGDGDPRVCISQSQYPDDDAVIQLLPEQISLLVTWLQAAAIEATNYKS
jgi:hypothetical protein